MIFPQEFLREMNFKASLLRKIEVARLNEPQKYFALAKKYKAQTKKFNVLPARELREVVEELKGG